MGRRTSATIGDKWKKEREEKLSCAAISYSCDNRTEKPEALVLKPIQDHIFPTLDLQENSAIVTVCNDPFDLIAGHGPLQSCGPQCLLEWLKHELRFGS